MRSFISFGSVFALAIATPAVAQDASAVEAPAAEAPAAEAPAAETARVEVKKGEAIYTADGKRVGKVYQVSRDGDAQFIQDLRMLTVPAATLSRVDGKLTTSLSRKEIR